MKNGPGVAAKVQRPKKTALLIAHRLVQLIQEEDLQPGDRLPPEGVMLTQYQVSRGTLRESLRYLELQGVITLKPGPGGGPVVQQPDSGILISTLTLLLQFQKTPFADIIEARSALEPGVVRLAAMKRTEADLEELWDNVSAAQNMDLDSAAFHQLSDEYHALIAQASGNAIYLNLMSALVGTLSGVNQGIDYPPRHRAASNEIHRDIVEAIADQDADRAAQLMRVHLEVHSKFTAKQYPDQVTRPVEWIS